MRIEQDSLKPIYQQIAEGIEDDILNGILEADDQAYSQYQISRQFGINPATAAKGINLLVSEGILYKKRGMGMHVAENAKQMIQKKRKNAFMNGLLKEILLEAHKLGIDRQELIKMIEQFEGVGEA